jgi:hypothetical protein
MAKTKRGTTVQHTAATLPPPGVPAAAPMRPATADEAETAHVKQTDPHRTGADRTPVLRAHVSAAATRLAAKKAASRKRSTTAAKAAAKPVAKTASKKKSAAAQPAAAAETY